MNAAHHNQPLDLSTYFYSLSRTAIETTAHVAAASCTTSYDDIKHKKKPRTSFNKKQITALEECFISHKYLSSGDRNRLSKELGLTDTQVKTWFQNRRTKWRRQDTEQRSLAITIAAEIAARKMDVPHEQTQPCRDLRNEKNGG